MQCVVIKSSVRCTNDSTTFLYGLTLPIIKPETQAYICGDCIADMYEAIVARDVPTRLTTPEQARKELGLA